MDLPRFLLLNNFKFLNLTLEIQVGFLFLGAQLFYATTSWNWQLQWLSLSLMRQNCCAWQVANSSVTVAAARLQLFSVFANAYEAARLISRELENENTPGCGLRLLIMTALCLFFFFFFPLLNYYKKQQSSDKTANASSRDPVPNSESFEMKPKLLRRSTAPLSLPPIIPQYTPLRHCG